MPMKNNTQEQTNQGTTEKPPAIGQRVIVITKDYRCLGYFDEGGIWRYNTDGTRIENVIGWRRDLYSGGTDTNPSSLN